MVTAMEDACPNGVREEAEELTPPGQPGVEGPSAVQSPQEPDASGGEERRRKRCGVMCLDERGDAVVFLWDGGMEGSEGSAGRQVTRTELAGGRSLCVSVDLN